jgi:hypothetical protein
MKGCRSETAVFVGGCKYDTGERRNGEIGVFFFGEEAERR